MAENKFKNALGPCRGYKEAFWLELQTHVTSGK